MLKLEEAMEIKILHQQGHSMRSIAKRMGISRNTVKKYLEQPEPLPAPSSRRDRSSKLDPHRDYIQQRLAQAHPKWIPSTVMYRELQARGYAGGERILRAYMASLKPKVCDQPVQRFETPPGEQMQVDWACLRRRSPRLSAFVATLGWSRHSYVHIVDHEQIDNLLECHVKAFDYFGGVPQKVLYDNAKTIVLQRHAYGQGLHRFHPALWDLAGHYGFLPKLCQPHRPQTKGKVERFISYLKSSYYIPTESRYRALSQAFDCASANMEVLKWLRDVANVRTHQTTGCIPQQQWLMEQAHLQPLPPAYRLAHQFKQEPHWSKQSQDHLQHDLSVYEQLCAKEVMQ